MRKDKEIDFDNFSFEGQNFSKVLRIFENLDELSKYDYDSEMLAAIWFVCFYHQDTKLSEQFIKGFKDAVYRQGAKFILAHQWLLEKVISILENIEQISNKKYIFCRRSDIFSIFGIYKKKPCFLLQEYSDRSIIAKAGKDFAHILLRLFYTVELNEFMSFLHNKQLQHFPKTELVEALISASFLFPGSVDALISVIINNEQAAIFVILGSGLFLERLCHLGELNFIFSIFRHFCLSKESFLTEFKGLTQILTDQFFINNAKKFLSIIKFNLRKELISNIEIETIRWFSDLIFSRWLNLSSEFESIKEFYWCNAWLILEVFDDLPILAAIALFFVQNWWLREYKFFGPTGGRGFDLNDLHGMREFDNKLLSLRDSSVLLSLGELVIQGKFPYLTLHHYGAPANLIHDLLRSESFANQEPQQYVSLLLRPVLTNLWWTKYFKNLTREYTGILERFSRTIPVSTLAQLNTPNNTAPLTLHVPQDSNINSTFQSVLTNSNEETFSVQGENLNEKSLVLKIPTSITLFPTRKTFNLAEQETNILAGQAQVRNNERLFNSWLLNRMYSKVTLAEERQRLNEFKTALQSRLTALLTGFKSLQSGLISPQVGNGIFDFIIAKSIGGVPIIGPILESIYGSIGPINMLKTYLVKEKISQFENILASFKEMDRLTERVSIFLTTYNHDEILEASKNETVFKKLYTNLTSGPILKLIRAIIYHQVEKHITGTDDKITPINTHYMKHWNELIELILARFVTDIVQFQSNGTKTLNAELLCAQLVPVSDEPLLFDLATLDTFSLKNAYTLSRLAMLAYERESKIRSFANLWNYLPNEVLLRNHFFIYKNDVQVFALADNEKICISFRGTATAMNVLSDLNCRSQHVFLFRGKPMMVHAGFWNCLNEIWLDLEKYIKNHVSKLLKQKLKPPQLFWTGHSLGGALATLAALKISQSHLMLPAQIYTFGQPKCGDEVFVDYMNHHFNNNYFRIINYLDLIPRVPTKPTKYTHAGEIWWFDFNGRLYSKREYEAKMQEIDKYGQQQVRENSVQLLRHINDHCMFFYQLVIEKSIKERNDLYNPYIDFLWNEFQTSFNGEVNPNSEYTKLQDEVHSLKAQVAQQGKKIEEQGKEIEELKQLIKSNLNLIPIQQQKPDESITTSSQFKQGFWGHSLRKELLLNESNTRWYSDDEINSLVMHVSGNNENIEYLTPMLGTNLDDYNLLCDSLLRYNSRRLNIPAGARVKDRVIMPVNLRGNRWVLFYITYLPSPAIYYFDPLGNQVPEELQQTLNDKPLFPGLEIILLCEEQLQNDSLGIKAASPPALTIEKSEGNSKEEKIGPRTVENFSLEDVADDGNCYYRAVVHQMGQLNHSVMFPAGTLSHERLRLMIQGELFKDRQWADITEILTTVRRLNVIVAIIDTRFPHLGFRCYYVDIAGRIQETYEPTLPPKGTIIRLAFTGNHYLSVMSHPTLSAGAIRNSFNPNTVSAMVNALVIDNDRIKTAITIDEGQRHQRSLSC